MSSIDSIAVRQKQLKANKPKVMGELEYQEFLKKLEHSPDLLLIGCNDARLPIASLGMDHGKALVLRTPAAYVLEKPARASSEAAVIEDLGITAKKVTDIVFLGHTDCNAIGCCLKGKCEDTKNLPNMMDYLEPLEAERQRVLKEVPEKDRALAMEQAAVCAGMDNLEKTYPAVTKAVAEGRVRLHGWVLDIEKALSDPPQPYIYEVTDRKNKTFELLADIPQYGKKASAPEKPGAEQARA